MATINAYEYAPKNKVYTCDQLTAAATATDTFALLGGDNITVYDRFLFELTIAGISTNVILQVQGSLTGSNWFNLDDSDTDTTYTANGTYGLKFDGEGKGQILYMRLYWVSELGGTSATIDAKLKFFRGE